MKSTLSCLILSGLLVVLGGTGFTFGQQDDADRGSKHPDNAQQLEERDVDPEDDEAQVADEELSRRKRRAPLSRSQLIAKLGKLQAAMKERLDLTPGQEEIIDPLFEEQVQSIKEAMDRRKRDQAQEDDLEAIRELQEQLKEARKAGDKERAREIRRQMSDRFRQRRSNMPEPIGRFIEKVAGELEEEQVSTFRTLAKRFGLDETRRPRRRPMGNLMRAVMSPEVGLSREQQQSVRELMRGHMSAAKPREMDDKQEKEAFDKLRDEVLTELTPEQRAKVEARLEELKKERPWKGPDRQRRRARIERVDEEPGTDDAPHEDD